MVIGKYGRFKFYFDYLGWIRCLEIIKGIGSFISYYLYIYVLVMVKLGFYFKGCNNYFDKFICEKFFCCFFCVWWECCGVNYNF